MSKKFVALKAKTEKVGSEKLIYKDLKEFFELNRKVKDLRPSPSRKRKPSSEMRTERARGNRFPKLRLRNKLNIFSSAVTFLQAVFMKLFKI